MATERKTVLTTREVAEAAQEAGRTVRGWAEGGQLVGYRTPSEAGQGHWRFRLDAVLEFFRKQGLPLDQLELLIRSKGRKRQEVPGAT